MAVTTHTPDQADNPLVLLQVGTYVWNRLPEGMDPCNMGMNIDSRSDAPEWVQPFIDDEGNIVTTQQFWDAAMAELDEYGVPLLRVEWRPYAIFATLLEAETHAKEVGEQWQCWKTDVVQALDKLGLLLGVIKQYDEQQAAIYKATAEFTKKWYANENVLKTVFPPKFCDVELPVAQPVTPPSPELELPFTYNEPEAKPKDHMLSFYAWAEMGYGAEAAGLSSVQLQALKDSGRAVRSYMSAEIMLVNQQTMADIEAAFPDEKPKEGGVD